MLTVLDMSNSPWIHLVEQAFIDILSLDTSTSSCNRPRVASDICMPGRSRARWTAVVKMIKPREQADTILNNLETETQRHSCHHVLD